MLALIFVGAMMLVPASASAQTTFSDVAGHEAQEIILKMAEQGLAAGYEDGTFKPDQYITRAELLATIKLAWPGATTVPASLGDIEAMAWYVDGLADNLDSSTGTVTGPEATVTNEEAAVIVAHLKNLKPDESVLPRFSDGDAASPWSRGAIGAVVKAGLMTGYADGTFQPGRFITRAEALTALQKALDYKAPSGASWSSASLGIKDIEMLYQNIVVFDSRVAGAEVVWNGVTLEGIKTVQGTNAINVPLLIPGTENTLTIKRPGYTRFSSEDIVWGSPELQIINGGFETGDLEGWQVVTGGPFPQVQDGTAAEGEYAAYMGDGAAGLYLGGGTASLSQTISIGDEARTPYLNLNYLVSGSDPDPGYDEIGVWIDGSQIASWDTDSGGWQSFQYDLSDYADQEVELTIVSWTTDELFAVGYYVDDVHISYEGGAQALLTPLGVTATPVGYQQPLSSSLLSGIFLNTIGDSVEGTLDWLNPGQTVANNNGHYVYIFAPDDNKQYLPVANTIQVESKSSRRDHTPRKISQRHLRMGQYR